MDELIYDALVDLKKSVDKQNELQADANQVLRGLIGALEETAQALSDHREQLAKTRNQ